jgi:hypothetical protein
MINRWLPAVLLLLMCSCGHSKKEIMQAVKDNELLQEKTINGFAFKMQYMPSGDLNMLKFRLNITESNGSAMKAADNNKFSYGLDSLFGIVNVTDTIHPVDVVRVANGNIGGVEYMLLFDRPAAYSNIKCFLYFRDQLFTQQLITFPLKGSAINHIDSLSQKI